MSIRNIFTTKTSITNQSPKDWPSKSKHISTGRIVTIRTKDKIGSPLHNKLQREKQEDKVIGETASGGFTNSFSVQVSKKRKLE